MHSAGSGGQGADDLPTLPEDLYQDVLSTLPADLYSEEAPALPIDMGTHEAPAGALPIDRGTQAASGAANLPHTHILPHARVSLYKGMHAPASDTQRCTQDCSGVQSAAALVSHLRLCMGGVQMLMF